MATVETTDTWELVETCGACPEQYDLRRNGEGVGYFRLRHGWFFVEVTEPDAPVYSYAGTRVFEAHPKGDGMFEDDERQYYLSKGVRAVLKHLGVPKPMRKPLALDIVTNRSVKRWSGVII